MSEATVVTCSAAPTPQPASVDAIDLIHDGQYRWSSVQPSEALAIARGEQHQTFCGCEPRILGDAADSSPLRAAVWVDQDGDIGHLDIPNGLPLDEFEPYLRDVFEALIKCDASTAPEPSTVHLEFPRGSLPVRAHWSSLNRWLWDLQRAQYVG